MLANDSETSEVVAIKLMKRVENYNREINSRDSLDGAYVVPLRECYSGDYDEVTLSEHYQIVVHWKYVCHQPTGV
jgi:hypothetical protein